MGWKDTITQAAPEAQKGGWRASISKAAPDVSMIESGLRGAAQGATMGFADEISGLAESALTDKTYEQARDESRANFEASQTANPIAYGTGNVAGSAATLAIPGLNAAKGASLAMTAGKAALQGGLAGIGGSEATGLGLVGDATKGAVIGGALGGVGGVVANKLSQARGTAADALTDFAETRAVKSLGPILKQQEKLDGMGLTNELGRELLDSGVVKAGRSVDNMINPLEEQLAQRGQAIGWARDKATNLGANVNMADDAANAAIAANAPGQLADEVVRSGTFADNLGAVANDNIPVNDVQNLVGRVNESINFNKVPGTQNAKEAGNIDLRKYLVSKMDESMASRLPEGDMANYQQNKRLFSGLAQGEDILDKASARQAKNATFGLRDTAMAASQLARPDGNGLTAAAMAIGSKIVRERGNSTVAVGADKLAQVLKSNPEKFGEYAQVLSQAAARGGNSLAATHYLLQQSNPNYRETVKLNEEAP